MDESNLHPDDPMFHSLTEIMVRFRSVPYEQFQSELQNWFEQSLSKENFFQNKGGNESDLNNLSKLVSAIYYDAELHKSLSDSKINLSDESK